jgi:hypothetical protein
VISSLSRKRKNLHTVHLKNENEPLAITRKLFLKPDSTDREPKVLTCLYLLHNQKLNCEENTCLHRTYHSRLQKPL